MRINAREKSGSEKWKNEQEEKVKKAAEKAHKVSVKRSG